MFYIKQFLC